MPSVSARAFLEVARQALIPKHHLLADVLLCETNGQNDLSKQLTKCLEKDSLEIVMNPELWQRVKVLFDAAVELPADQRRPYVAEACGEDLAMKQEVESLLSAHDERSDTLESPRVKFSDFKIVEHQDLSKGEVILGRYRIIRLLGEGGMGVVYEAEQDQPRRRVALKVIKAALASPDMLRRFEQEFQTLGRLHHPGIAQIYDAGAADSGFGSQPFFAMELIVGKPLSAYADEHKLTTRERLSLMIQVCEAVHHAHQAGIIHRDLKPGNILVDETGQPKILDFGLARVTDSDVQATRQTDIGQLLGTLPYMSPEQVSGDSHELDRRSDVYALGVILYELLTDRLPYELSRQLHEVVYTIQQVDPVPLSSINRAYRGDIETIVDKALEKEKARRYASAADLASDIQRHLDDLPITAKPASSSYRLQKFARRNKPLIAGVAAVFLVLVLGIVASTWLAVKARRAEAHAEAEAASSQAVNDFLQKDLLAQAGASAQSSSGAKPDPDIKVRTALDRAAERIQGKFDKQPEVEAAIRNTMGQTYYDLGLFPEAGKQLQRALELRRKALGPENEKTLETMNNLGQVAIAQGKLDEAETLYNHTLEVERRVLVPDHLDTLASLKNLAIVYTKQGKYKQAESLETQTLATERRVLGPEDPDTLSSMNTLGNIYFSEEKYAQAESLYSQTLEMKRRTLGPEHPSTVRTMMNLASAYHFQSKFPQAESTLTQVLDIDRRTLGPEHPNTLNSTQNLASVYLDEGKFQQAQALYSQIIGVFPRIIGPDNPETLALPVSLARAYYFQGNYAEAEPLLIHAMENEKRVLGPEHPFTLEAVTDLASLYQREGKYGLAEKYYAQDLAGLGHTLGDQDPNLLGVKADLAVAYLSQGEFAKSEPIARAVLDIDKKIEPDSSERYHVESILGASLAGEKKFAEAEPLLLDGYQGMLAQKATDPFETRYALDLAHTWLVRLYEAWGKPGKAAEWKSK